MIRIRDITPEQLLPLTLHNVLTIRSALAGVMKALSKVLATELESDIPNVLLVSSATVPIPNPANRPPNDTTRAILDAGTALSLALSLN